jgi:hypothetical protein
VKWFLVVSIWFLVLAFPLKAEEEPVQGFVILEPFEVRVEALSLPKAYAAEWGLSGANITSTQKDQILAKTLELLKTKTAIKTTGQTFNFDSTHVRFVMLSKDLGYVPDDREEIPLNEALIGSSMSSMCKQVDDLEIAWNWFAPGQVRVPVHFNNGSAKLTDKSENMARFLTPDAPFMSWKRTKQASEVPRLLPIMTVEKVRREHQPILLKTGLGILALAGLIVLIMKTKTPPLIFFLIPLGIVALFGAFRFAKLIPVLPDGQKAEDLVRSLLRNTYHAFDFRDESEIYDTLQESISSGLLLESVYLEVRKGLELEIRGGPRIRIKGIDLHKCDVIAKNDDEGTFDVQAEWVSVGDVNHWGHSHLRTNRYKANLRIGNIKETWKITKMQILDEERTQQVTPTD